MGGRHTKIDWRLLVVAILIIFWLGIATGAQYNEKEPTETRCFKMEQRSPREDRLFGYFLVCGESWYKSGIYGPELESHFGKVEFQRFLEAEE